MVDLDQIAVCLGNPLYVGIASVNVVVRARYSYEPSGIGNHILLHQYSPNYYTYGYVVQNMWSKFRDAIRNGSWATKAWVKHVLEETAWFNFVHFWELTWLGNVNIQSVYINSPWTSDTIWRHSSGSTLVKITAWYLTAPNHCMSKCWLIINKNQWHLTRDTSAINI